MSKRFNAVGSSAIKMKIKMKMKTKIHKQPNAIYMAGGSSSGGAAAPKGTVWFTVNRRLKKKTEPKKWIKNLCGGTKQPIGGWLATGWGQIELQHLAGFYLRITIEPATQTTSHSGGLAKPPELTLATRWPTSNSQDQPGWQQLCFVLLRVDNKICFSKLWRVGT